LIKNDLAQAIIFVHSSIDDAGLTPQEFRVYCHIARRAGRGEAFPGIPSIAKTCRLEDRSVRSALKSLNERGMLKRRDRTGMSSVFALTLPSEWGEPLPSGTRGPLPSGTPSAKGTPSPLAPGDPSPLAPGEPLPFGTPLRISIEGDPLKGIQSLVHSAPETQKFRRPGNDEVETYAATINLVDWKGFFDFYESNGWKVGRNPMKDWHAAARRWGREESKKPGKGAPGAKAGANRDDRSTWPDWKLAKVEGFEEKYRVLKKRVDTATAHPKDYDAQSRGQEALMEMDKIRSTLRIEFGVDPCKE